MAALENQEELGRKLQCSDPHWFQCGSGSSFLSQCGFRSREQHQCGSMCIRIQIRSELCHHKEDRFQHEKYTLCRYYAIKHIYVGAKAILICWKSGWFANFGHILAPGSRSGSSFPIRIRIRIPNMVPNPDPGEQNQCGYMRIQRDLKHCQAHVCPQCANIWLADKLKSSHWRETLQLPSVYRVVCG